MFFFDIIFYIIYLIIFFKMTCTLTVVFGYLGNPSAEIVNFTVADDTYDVAYKVARPDLYTPSEQKVYSVRSTGSAGELTLATYYPGQIDVTITSSSNSCSIKHDCINGNCIQSNVYNTPGIYSSLTNCQNACSQDTCEDGYICLPSNYVAPCPQGSECVSLADTQTLVDLLC